MHIILTSVGRRGYLVKFFREALGSDGEIWGADNTRYTPAFRYCDNSVLLPKVMDPFYVDRLIQLCTDNNIDMIVPLIDPELEVLATNKQRFIDANIMVVVSPLKTIEISSDKYLTYKFGKDNGIAVPETVLTIEESQKLLTSGKVEWPLMVKPRKGSASTDITYCYNQAQLEGSFQSCPMPMIQEIINGKEYGYDIFCDQNYRPISVFCKRKLLMRAGETDKAVSTDDPDLIALGKKIAEKLQIIGPIDVDVMLDGNGPKLLEINPRFGGGYPCAHLCGARFPAKLVSMCRNNTLTPDIGSCQAGIYMFKQDEIISFTKKYIDSIQEYG